MGGMSCEKTSHPHWISENELNSSTLEVRPLVNRASWTVSIMSLRRILSHLKVCITAFQTKDPQASLVVLRSNR